MFFGRSLLRLWRTRAGFRQSLLPQGFIEFLKILPLGKVALPTAASDGPKSSDKGSIPNAALELAFIRCH